jgi:predicted nuclease of predicted toxin-antitoxin system
MTDRALVVWLDAQLSPALSRWLQADFGVAAQPIRELGLRNAEDPIIFAAGENDNKSSQHSLALLQT